MSKRGKNQAMLRRLRSRDEEEDAADAQNNDTSRNDEAHEEALTRLLDRLRREYAQNFHGEMNDRPEDIERARYLLEATAGNVGLASMLYWDDYLNDSAGRLGGPPAAAAAGGNVAAGSNAAAPKKSLLNYEEMMAAIHAQNNPEGSDATRGFAHRKRAEREDGEEQDERKPPSNNDNNDLEEAVQRALAESRRLREHAQRDNPEQAVQRALAESARLREEAQRNNNQAAAAAARRGLDMESSPRRDVNVNPLEHALDAPPPPVAGRRRLPREFLDLEGFLQEVNRVVGAGGGAAFAGLPAAGLPAAGLQPGLPAAGVPADRLARMQHQLMNPAAPVGGGGGDLLQLLDPINEAPSARISDLLSRLFQGQQLNDEERRDLMAGLGIENGQEFDNMSWLFRDAAGAARGVAAAGGGAGGDDDPDSNNDSDNDAALDVDGSRQEGGAAPLRRSGRLRAQRNRRSRGRRSHDAAGGALGRIGMGGVGRFRRALNDGGAVSDDDDLFVPGPDPVFREISAGKAESKVRAGKRKKGDDLNIRAKHLHGGEDDDSMSAVSDASSVDMSEFFDETDESILPLEFLWGANRVDNDESDDDDRTSIPRSWLRTGFTLSECGNGLSMMVPSDDEWEIVRRSHPQIIRDGQRLKSIKGLFPYHCKGVSAILSIVTALIYSGASIRGNTVSCNADLTPFEDLTLEQRQREFPKRLIDALSALIFLAAQSTSIRCANALARMDKHHNYRRKKHNLSQEDEDEFTLKRLKMVRRVRQCRVSSWEPDTANQDAPMLPRGRDPRDIRVHSSLTNIDDIKAYVRSHLRSFTEPGGCALFLETIARAHGAAYFKRLIMPKTDELSELSTVNNLVGCKCKASLEYLEKKSKDQSLPDAMPNEHDCIRVELLSLLLTGQVHGNYENWNADKLGIGLLRIDRGSTNGPRLLRPVKPIWLCLGDFGYSTLMLDKTDFIGKLSSLDEPGKAFRLAHWDCWAGERTTMKVITSVYDQLSNTSSVPFVSDVEEDAKRTVAESIVDKMVEERKRDTVNPNMYGISPKHSFRPITDEELQSIKFHPEDEKFYPKDYKRWRFNVGGGSGWVSFFRLSVHQKLVVEMKLAPRICLLVRSRWPLAAVRDFVPEKRVPLV